MSIEFAGVRTILEATDNEVTEYNLALEALSGAKGELVTAQEAANVAQLAVTAATESVSKEKADVVSGIAAAIATLNALLSELQE
jgi:hypothetical protein